VLHEIRRDVDRVVILKVVEAKRAARKLGRNGPARLVLVLLERLFLVLGWRGRTEVLLTRAAGCAGSAAPGVTTPAAEAARTWASEATASAASAISTAAAKTTGTRRPKSAAWTRRTSRTAILAGARFADGQWTAHKKLAVKLLDRGFRGGPFGVLDKRKAPCPAGLAIERADDLRGLTDLREMRTQIFFGCLIGQVAHEQSDWWHV